MNFHLGAGMKKHFEDNLIKVRLISRIVFWGSIPLMMNTIILAKYEYRDIRNFFFFLGLITFFVYWMVPTFFLVIKKQDFAIAWLIGLSNWEKFKDFDFKTLRFADKLSMIMNSVLACVGLAIFIYVLNFAFTGGNPK